MELEPKCLPQLFVGLLLGTHQSAIGHFSLSPVTFPDVFAKVRSIQSPSSFMSDKFRRYALDPIGLNPLRHLMKFAQPSIPYRFGIVVKVKQQY